MNQEKLESLRKLAADERTPVDEARNAALAYVRGGGEIKAQSVTIDDVRRLADVAMIREAFGGELDALKREEASKREKMQSEIDALKKQLSELRSHGKAILAFIQGEPERKEANLYGSPFPFVGKWR